MSAAGGPFGALYQEEAAYLSLAGASPAERVVLLTLRIRWDRQAKTCRDTLNTLARWCGMSRRQVQYALDSLKRRGLIVRAVRPAPEGERRKGQAWSWTTTPLPYECWPTLYGVWSEEERALAVFSSPEERARDDEERAQNGGRARKTTRHNPDTYPEVFPDPRSARRSSLRSKDGGRTSDYVRCRRPRCPHYQSEHFKGWGRCRAAACTCESYLDRDIEDKLVSSS